MVETSPTTARAIYDSVINADDPLTHIRSWISSSPPTFESEYLEFKGRPVPKDGDPDPQKRLWSEALSGFANTGGGVLVWGVKARDIDGSGVDCAVGETLIEDVFQFQSRL